MPRSFLLSWRKIPSLTSRFASRYACFLDLRLTQPCKGEKERGESNIGNFRNKNKHNISPMIIPMPPFLSLFPPPPSPSTRPPPPIPTAFTISIVMPWPHPPRRNQSRPTQNPTQKPLLFYGRCGSRIRYFFTKKKIGSLTGNTGEALQCVRLHQKDP